MSNIIEQVTATPNLRFVLRWDGDRQTRILQQEWVVRCFYIESDHENSWHEWRDVPLVDQ